MRGGIFAATAWKVYNVLLDYCNGSPTSPAGRFLRRIGVEEMPSAEGLAAAIASNHERVFSRMRGGSTLITPKDYIKMLKRLASPFVSSTFSSLTGKKQELPATLKKDLASAPCLIEVKGEDWRPVAAADCVIDDHEVFAQKFATRMES